MQQNKINKTQVHNTPEMKFRAGPVSATVWNNPGKEDTTFQTITLERSYKDKEGNWQNTGVLRVGDLPKARVLLEKAYEHIVLKQNN